MSANGNGSDPMNGSDPVSCGAKTRSGGQCKRRAGSGTSHVGIGRCKLHGGASPKAEVAGVVTLARREAAVMGTPLDIDPHEALLECIRIASGEVRYASERIAELDPDEAVGPIVTTLTRPLKHEKGAESQSTTVEEIRHEALALHVWIQVRRAAMDRLVNYTKVAIAAGVEERRVRVAEQQAELLANAVRGILTDLGVSDHPKAPAAVRRHLTLLSGGLRDDAAAAA